ncbi:MAG: matrixin family metalloprotease [Paracoccaceae bacterium]
MFELLNVKWGEPTFGTPSGEITWSADLGDALPIAEGFDVEDLENSLRAAFDTWENVAAVDFEEVESGADVNVVTQELDWPIVGLAGPFPVDRGDFLTMTSAEVIFSETLFIPETGEALEWSPFGGGGTVDFFAVAVHEIGHIIGLEHPNDPTQIMNAIIQVDELGLGDIQGAQYLYGIDGEDVAVEPGVPDNADEIGLGEVDGGGLESGDGGGGGGGGGGLILGLLALIAAFFSGGMSVGLLAAGRVAMSNEDDGAAPEGLDDPYDLDDMTAEDVAAIFNSHQHCSDVVQDGGVYHGVTVAEMLPGVDFTQQPNPCGCVGLCAHILDVDEPEEVILL